MNWMPPERAVDARRQRPGQQRLADAGHVLDQDVPFGQQRDHGELDDLGLAQDDRADVVEQPVRAASRRPRGGGHLGGLGRIHAVFLAASRKRTVHSIVNRPSINDRPWDSNAPTLPRPHAAGNRIPRPRAWLETSAQVGFPAEGSDFLRRSAPWPHPPPSS